MRCGGGMDDDNSALWAFGQLSRERGGYLKGVTPRAITGNFHLSCKRSATAQRKGDASLENAHL